MEDQINKCKEVAKDHLQQVFDVVPLTDKQKELFITVAAAIYNRGGMDALKSHLDKTA